MWAKVTANFDQINAGSGCTAPAARTRAASWSLGGIHYLYGGSNLVTAYNKDFWKLTAAALLVSCPSGSEKVGEECLTCVDGKVSIQGLTCAYCPAGQVGNFGTMWYVFEPLSQKFAQMSHRSSFGFFFSVNCPAGKYRSGTMPACSYCAAGFEPADAGSTWYAPVSALNGQLNFSTPFFTAFYALSASIRTVRVRLVSLVPMANKHVSRFPPRGSFNLLSHRFHILTCLCNPVSDRCPVGTYRSESATPVCVTCAAGFQPNFNASSWYAIHTT
jgi:hypothetical protein